MSGSSSWLTKYLCRLGDREGDLVSSTLKREEGLITIGFIAQTSSAGTIIMKAFLRPRTEVVSD